MRGRFTFFGTSASMGVPIIGCECSVCLSDSPLNKRTRSAALLQVGEKKILVDVGPDIREQALKHRLTHLDALILTHTHYDHIAGLDDLRIFSFKTKQPLPTLVSEETMQDLKRRYFYLMEGKKAPKFAFQILEQDQGETEFLGLRLEYCFYRQMGMSVTGYRFGDLAFVTDIKEYSTSIFKTLEGCETLILSAIDWSPTGAHISIEEAIDIGKKTKAKRVLLTHIGHELDHEKTNQKLPPFMELAYDGMTVEFNL